MSPRVWRFVHNVVVHPLMEILPERWGDWLHNETGDRAFVETCECCGTTCPESRTYERGWRSITSADASHAMLCDRCQEGEREVCW